MAGASPRRSLPDLRNLEDGVFELIDRAPAHSSAPSGENEGRETNRVSEDVRVDAVSNANVEGGLCSV